MKKVINGDELRMKMSEAVDLICNAVSSTLGPSGNNVLIDSELSPFITNDGVTIAESIASDDKIINSILDIIKEASLKTNELVGDGTTTTLVLLKSIFDEGLSLVKSGKNAIVLRKELEESLKEIVDLLDKNKKDASSNDLISIAKTSCGDNLLGEFLTEVFLKVKSKYAIRIEEGKDEKMLVKYKKGYSFELDNVSNMYFLDKQEISLKNAYVLLYKGYLDNLETISEVINANKNVVILVADASDEVKEEILSYYLDYKKNIFLFLLPDYPSKRYAILNDVAFISGAKIKNASDSISITDLGKIDVLINKDEISFSITKDVNEYITEIEKEMPTLDEFDAYFLKERICKLKTGIATIYVGGITKAEIREKKMRVEDAINALEVASGGVTIGSGIKFLEISQELSLDTDGSKILSLSLNEPFKKIYENCGEDYSKWKDIIRVSNYQKIYNLKTKTLEDVDKTSILDPTQVLKVAISNAVSIASILLTTNYLVINENLNQNSSNEY